MSALGQGTSVCPREEVVGWHSYVRQGVSLGEHAEGVPDPSQEICAWYLHEGGRYTTAHGHCGDSSPLLLFPAPGTSSVLIARIKAGLQSCLPPQPLLTAHLCSIAQNLCGMDGGMLVLLLW